MRPWPLALAIALAVGAIGIDRSAAQDYPSRPVTIVIPFPPGGAFDVTGRIIAERMRLALGQPVIIENVGGAAGNIGVARVARAAPDGYTLSYGIWTRMSSMRRSIRSAMTW